MDDDTHNSDDLLQETNLGNSLDVDENQLQADNQPQSVAAYPFQSSNREQVSYKVVQVGNANNTPQAGLNIINSTEFQNFLSQQGTTSNDTPQVALVAGSSFSEGVGSSATNSSSAQQASKLPLAYFSNTVRNTTSNDQESSQSDQSTNPSHFYLLMSPQDVITQPQEKQPSAMRHFDVTKICEARNVSTRRIQHNEVERRRRDKINTWIMKLSDIVPSCASDQSKQGQSKGGILAKTCDYITDLQQTSKQFENISKELERLRFELKVTKVQLKDKQQENEILHQTLRDHGLAVDITSTRTTS